MIDPKTLSDDRFLAAFLDGSMPPSGFDHHGHVRAAWILLRRYPLDQAVKEVCGGIERLATRLGVPDKYHRTLSEALVRLMSHGGARPDQPWEGFLRANPLLMDDARALLARHYSAPLLATPAARRSFVPPDLAPLPPEVA